MSEIKLTAKDDEVLAVVCGGPREGLGPTAIGVKLGKPYWNASSYVMGSLKKLAASGAVTRHVPKGGVVLYRAAETQQ